MTLTTRRATLQIRTRTYMLTIPTSSADDTCFTMIYPRCEPVATLLINIFILRTKYKKLLVCQTCLRIVRAVYSPPYFVHSICSYILYTVCSCIYGVQSGLGGGVFLR